MAEVAWREFVQLAERSRHVGLAVAAQGPQIFFDFIDGRLEAAVAGLNAMLQHGQEAGVGGTLIGGRGDVVYGITLARLYYYLGSPAILLEELLPVGESRPQRVNRALINGFLGKTEAALSDTSSFGNIGSDDDESGTQFLVNIFETSILVRDFAITAALERRLAPVADHLAEGRLNCVDVSIGRLCGEAAVLLGRPDEARDFYAQGLGVCEKVRFRPEIALIRLGLAELLLEHYPDERGAAIEHLDFAIAELRDMKMQPALERALRHRGLLKA
jgi:hypothetical protein